jgi:hypothetical protein
MGFDTELEMVKVLVDRTLEAGILSKTVEVINFYISFKSESLIILKGPATSGKLEFVRLFAQSVIGEDNYQLQMMVGHPYWASGSLNVAMFTAAQSRFNTAKILTLVEEAWRRRNRQKVYIACLVRISPGEIESYFSENAIKTDDKHLVQLPYAFSHLPIPFPPNLYIVGTMDTPRITCSSELLHSNAAILNWPGRCADGNKRINDKGNKSCENIFLQSCVRNEYAARSKLRKILGWGLVGLEKLSVVENLLGDYGIEISTRARAQVLVYLANAWTKMYAGLFHPSPTENLNIALDLAVSQTLLPHMGKIVVQREGLTQRLISELGKQWPLTFANLDERIPSMST